MSARGALALRDAYEWLRYTPGVRLLNPLWRRLERPYLALVRALAGGDAVPVRVAGEVVLLTSKYAMVPWEREETVCLAAFRAALPAGGVVMDVGAFLGLYALVGARWAGPTGHVVAFEPMPGTRVVLERHVAWNGLQDRVTVRGSACGDATGTIALHATRDEADSSVGALPRPGALAVMVPRTTLDAEAVLLGRPVAVVKIDVEGQELAVLRGGAAMIARDKPVLLVSVHVEPLREQGLAPADVYAWLDAAGYAHRVIAEDHEVHVLATPRSRA